MDITFHKYYRHSFKSLTYQNFINEEEKFSNFNKNDILKQHNFIKTQLSWCISQDENYAARTKWPQRVATIT